MNGKNRLTGAKTKAHSETESGSDKKNKKSDNSGTNGNRPKFANSADMAAKKFNPHLTDNVAMQLLEKGSVLRGTIRINQRSYEDAYVSSPDDANLPDIYVGGLKDRNRALHGDEVFVMVEDKSRWKVLADRIRDYLEAKEDGKGKGSLTAEDVALKMSALKFRKDEQAEVQINKGTAEENSVAPVPSSSPLPGAGSTTEALAENGAARQKVEEDDNDSHDGGSNDDVVMEKMEVNRKEQALPKKKTRRGKRKSKSSKPSAEQDAQEQRPQVPKLAGRRSPTAQRNQRRSRKLTETAEPAYERDAVLAHPEWKRFVQRTARVVYISEQVHRRCGVGFLSIFPDGNPNFAKFSPTDHCVPRMKIPKDLCPKDFFIRPQDFRTFMYVCKISKWEQVNMALGELTKCLGASDDVKARTEKLLIERAIDTDEFSEEVNACLPATPFVIPAEEASIRRDFREECVFTIDPMTARDLDDALSVERRADGNFRVGVHIADVSYFIREGSALDLVASKRATSVYLVQTVVPMLPRLLCEQLCSLNPSEDRLTFTVEWIMNAEGDILEEWFGRSIIRSCVKLAYEHAQSMLDSPEKKWSKDELPEICDPYDASVISKKVNYLQILAVKLRERRVANGALRLDQPKITFSMDRETMLPQGFQLYEHRHSNKLIEEFMLLANSAVAKKIADAYPQQAMLRRHPEPKRDVMASTLEMLDQCDPPIKLDSDTSKTLADSLKCHDDLDPTRREKYLVLVSLLSKTMSLAEYFCTGEELPQICETKGDFFRHYALSVEHYTHFTSPIRRYPDLVVHRMLDAALAGKSIDNNTSEVCKIAKICNQKKLDAKMAGDESASLFLALFIKKCGQITAKAMVKQVMDRSVECLIFEIATVKRIYFDQIPQVAGYEYKRRAGRAEVILTWKPQNEATQQPRRQVLRLFTEVTVSLSASPDKDFEFVAVIEHPDIKK